MVRFGSVWNHVPSMVEGTSEPSFPIENEKRNGILLGRCWVFVLRFFPSFSFRTKRRNSKKKKDREKKPSVCFGGSDGGLDPGVPKEKKKGVRIDPHPPPFLGSNGWVGFGGGERERPQVPLPSVSFFPLVEMVSPPDRSGRIHRPIQPGKVSDSYLRRKET